MNNELRENIKSIEKDFQCKCQELRNEAKKKKIELVKKTLKWEIGSRVTYTDRDGGIQGEFIAIDDDGKVAVLVDMVNGFKTKKSLSIFHYEDLI